MSLATSSSVTQAPILCNLCVLGVSIFIGSSNELGEFESGVVARLLGAVPAAVLGGIVCLATVFVVASLSPRLRKLNLDELKIAHDAPL